MAAIGLPVPPGFTITTEVSPSGLWGYWPSLSGPREVGRRFCVVPGGGAMDQQTTADPQWLPPLRLMANS